MTFIPLLGYYLLRPKAEPSIAGAPQERVRGGVLPRRPRSDRHRWAFLAGSLVVLVLGGAFMSQLKTQFFPAGSAVPLVRRRVAAGRRAGGGDEPRRAARSRRRSAASPTSTRKAHSEDPSQAAPGAEVADDVRRRRRAALLVLGRRRNSGSRTTRRCSSRSSTSTTPSTSWTRSRRELSATIPGARIDVRQLETGPPVGIPVSIRVSGEDIAHAAPPRRRGRRHPARRFPTAARVRDNWGPESFAVRLRTDSDKANLSGLTNYDVAAASASAMTGRAGRRRCAKATSRFRSWRACAWTSARSSRTSGASTSTSAQGTQKVPLQSISSIVYEMQTEKLQRRNQFRTITISAFPEAGVLPSEVLDAAMPRLETFAQRPARRLSHGDRRRARGAGQGLHEPGDRAC